MSDYPKDGGKGIADHFSADKMLFEVPDDIASPAVRVNDDIYFVNELLQLSNSTYFIPQRFFYAKPQSNGDASDEDLSALGYRVEKTDVWRSFVLR
jgi:hypothetical protein